MLSEAKSRQAGNRLIWVLIVGVACLPIGMVGCEEGSTVSSVEIRNDFLQLDDPSRVFFTDPFAEKISSLSEVERENVTAMVKARLASEHAKVRRRAALTLGYLEDKSGVPVMIKDMSIKDNHTRGNVTVALRVLKDKRAIPVLTKALTDSSAYVRSIAICALGEMKAQGAFDEILAHLQDKEDEGGSCIRMTPADSACYALGALGDKRAIPFLIEALEDAQLVSQACQALIKLTGKKFGYDVNKWKEWWEENKDK